jgi:hypothetical protein
MYHTCWLVCCQRFLYISYKAPWFNLLRLCSSAALKSNSPPGLGSKRAQEPGGPKQALVPVVNAGNLSAWSRWQKKIFDFGKKWQS